MAELGEANIGGRMVPAWLLNLTAEELDSLKSRWYSNPNLLDNWYFGNPVNQRGQTEYTGPGYGIDRWSIEHDTVISLSGGSLVITSTTENGIVQNSEAIAELLDKRSVFSVLTTSGDLYSVSFPIGGISGGLDVGDFIIFSTSDTLLYIRSKGLSPKSILAVKLELGSTQTLAHRDGDHWVLNEMPDYGEQLRRCQRYHYRFNSHAYGWTYDNNTVNCLIPLPVTLRTMPAITLHTKGTINTTTGDAFVTSYEIKGVSPNGLIIDLHNSANAFTTGTPVVWHNFDMTVSADL